MFFYLRKLSTSYYKIDNLIEITFLSKKNIFLGPFYAILCDQKLHITIFREKKNKSIMLTVHIERTRLQD